eukprot:s2779_g1.t1
MGSAPADFGHVTKLKVKDESNCNFILRLLAAIGPVVPSSSVPEAALVEIAKKYNLLGESAEPADIEAWASREGDLHRGLMQYAMRRTGTSDAESSSESLCERAAEEESPTDDACVSFLAEGFRLI